MGTTEDGVTNAGTTARRVGRSGRRRARRVLLRGVTATVALLAVGTASAQQAGSGATGGGGGSGLYVTAAALALTGVAIGAVYLFSWRDRPERTYTPATPTEDRVVNRHTGPMYESDVAESETRSVDHDAFDPVGTGMLLAMYFAVISLLWLFMYFVEFLGNGPSVVG
jgi:hypothetical protein